RRQRLRQVHGRAQRHRPGAGLRGRDRTVRHPAPPLLRLGPRRLRPAAHHGRLRRARHGHRDRLLGPPCAHPLRRLPQVRPGGGAPRARPGRAGGPGEGLRRRPLRRPAPAGADRPRARRRARTADHGRADGGRGPREPGGPRHHAAPPGRRGRHGPPRPARTGPAGAPDRPGGGAPRRLRAARRPAAEGRGQHSPTLGFARAGGPPAGPRPRPPARRRGYRTDPHGTAELNPMDLLDYAFMQRALLAAVLVGITAPAVGIYLVQRRQALMGDGIGHVAMTGVGLGFLLSWSPVWMAALVSVLGAVLMELIRWYGRTRGDIALAMLFYGGMAGGVMFINLAPTGSTANLTSYLFGSLSTVSPSDVTAICVLAAFVILVTLGLRRQLFAVSQDEEFARVTGLPVRFLNLLVAVTAAVTVTVAMRVVGLLLVSALMVVPVAAAQQLTRSFAATFAVAVAIGVSVSLGGTVTSYYQDVPPGATIVLLTIGA